MKKTLIAVMLMSTADAQNDVINVSALPDSVIGLGKPDILILTSLFFVIMSVLIFSARYSGIGLIVAASVAWFFWICGWLAISPIFIVLIWVIALLHTFSKNRKVPT